MCGLLLLLVASIGLAQTPVTTSQVLANAYDPAGGAITVVINNGGQNNHQIWGFRDGGGCANLTTNSFNTLVQGTSKAGAGIAMNLASAIVDTNTGVLKPFYFQGYYPYLTVYISFNPAINAGCRVSVFYAGTNSTLFGIQQPFSSAPAGYVPIGGSSGSLGASEQVKPITTCTDSVTVSVAANNLTKVIDHIGLSGRIRICNFAFSGSVASVPVGIAYGTGANCAGGTTYIMPMMTMYNAPFVMGTGIGEILRTPIGDSDICVAAGAAGTVVGFISYAIY